LSLTLEVLAVAVDATETTLRIDFSLTVEFFLDDAITLDVSLGGKEDRLAFGGASLAGVDLEEEAEDFGGETLALACDEELRLETDHFLSARLSQESVDGDF
jgi:hypothetical protein